MSYFRVDPGSERPELDSSRLRETDTLETFPHATYRPVVKKMCEKSSMAKVLLRSIPGHG